MDLRRRCGSALLAAVALGPAPAAAAAAVDTVLGRQVPARADAPARATTSTPRAAWVLYCAGCHRVDGAGSRSAGVPDLRRLGAWLQVPGGREYIVGVPGVMGSGLDDAGVAAVVNWVLATLARDSAPPGHRPYAADEVARARAAPPLDVAGERARLQQRAQALGLQPW